MSKTSKKAKKEERVRIPAEYTEGSLWFKAGPGWKVCYDSERKIYTAESFLAGYYDLYEINEEIFGALKTRGTGICSKAVTIANTRIISAWISLEISLLRPMSRITSSI